ncbi:SGNH/GDSL hydrolase family protein [Pseudarthrobacter phenanthrenivorans]|uniref:SGNH hydrolase-type esterase domain-containing protein n=1 Tax=Pseudarthrobacter phenanthrenivorans TaxID=361575 RepID=A0A0B4DKR5_PSEPS|nr:SGNH/GDSL hydrolase family protein [Pseudarthrobacter phenanthrenivorans]KIC69442.1 hypothetical protein RM50_01815 [Pseudarthrobacter phenanthrenivorans]
MKRLALVFAAALLLTGCGLAAVPAAPDIKAKADAFEAKTKAEMEARAAAAAEARIIKLPVPQDRPLSVFYAGDSLSYSLYTSAEANGYRQLLNAELRKHGEIKEKRATKADEKALFKVGNVQDIPESGVDLAILELGTNDLGTNVVGSRTEPDLFRQQYLDLIAKVQRSPNVQIICVGVWGAAGPTISDPYDFAIEKACRGHGGQYVDLTAVYQTAGTFGPNGSPSWLGPSDNFHPNDKGHRMITDLILERLRFV